MFSLHVSLDEPYAHRHYDPGVAPSARGRCGRAGFERSPVRVGAGRRDLHRGL